MPKGSKTCPNCNAGNGPRAYACKNCNQPFSFKAKSREAKNTKVVQKVNWRELQAGERIRVGGGPYFVATGGKFVPMGYRGRFVVRGVDENGILAYGLDKHTGFAHIYMGRDTQNKETQVWKTKHRLVKLESKVKV